MSTQPMLRSDLTPLEFGLFRDWIHRHAGIFLEDSKADSLRLSLHTRAIGHGFTDYRDYFRLLSENEDEFRELLNLVTINETSFFRFPAQFDALRDYVIPALLGARGTGPVRVWSAGCSTGEEPYTIAMALLEAGLTGRGAFEVLGTDVSTQALERARSARYSGRTLSSLPPQIVERWFERQGADYLPIESARQACRFEFHNLIRDAHPPTVPSGWDVVFCRNVTIYFQAETTRRVIQHLYDALNPGGYLFLGHSETLASISDRFETVQAEGVFFYRKPLSPGTRAAAARQRGRMPASAPGPVARSTEKPPRGSVREPSDRPKRPCPPSSGDGLAIQAHRLLEQAKPVEALALAERAFQCDSNDVEARLVIAFAHADLGDLATAASEARGILADDPLSAPARYLLGVIRREQGATAAATSEFRRTLYVDGGFVLAHFALAGMHRSAGELAEAAREYENTLRALEQASGGAWTAFLGGFTPELLRQTCERGLAECRGGALAAKGAARTRR